MILAGDCVCITSSSGAAVLEKLTPLQGGSEGSFFLPSLPRRLCFMPFVSSRSVVTTGQKL